MAGQVDWRVAFRKEFRGLRARPFEFEPLIQSHSQLVRQNKTLNAQCQSMQKQVIILQHERQDTESAEMIALQGKVQQLQDELVGCYKASALSAELKLQVAALESARDRADAQLTAQRAELDALAVAKTQAEEVAGVLQSEVGALRELLAKREADCEALRRENDSFVMRMLEEKASMVAELNKMNDLVETLSAQLAAARRMEQDAKAAAESGGAAAAEDAGADLKRVSRTWSVAVTVPTTPRFTVKGHHTEINAVKYSDTSPTLFTGSSDGSLKVWDTSTGRASTTLRGGQPIVAVDVYDRLVAGASTDRTVRVWDVSKERVKFHATGHSNKVHAVRFSADGRLMVTGSTDRTIKVWDVTSGREVRSIRSSSTCNALDVSVDGSIIASGHQDGAVRLWDIGNGNKVDEAKPFQGQVTSVAFSPRGGMQILCNSRDNRLKLLDARSLDPVQVLTHDSFHTSYNWSRAAFSPDGQYVAAGSSTGTMHVWSIDSGRAIKNLKGHDTAVSSCAWAPGVGGWQQVASCDKGGYLVLWD